MDKKSTLRNGVEIFFGVCIARLMQREALFHKAYVARLGYGELSKLIRRNARLRQRSLTVL